jgi:hypothetical protein
MIGIVSTLGTAAVALTKIDLIGMSGVEAVEAANRFASFGPFAQLFVFTLVISVGSIAWWAKVTQTSIANHRKRNDDLLKIIVDSNHEKDEIIKEKDKIIAEKDGMILELSTKLLEREHK